MCMYVCACVSGTWGRVSSPLKIKSISLSQYETLVRYILLCIDYYPLFLCCCVVAVIMNFGTDVITSHSLFKSIGLFIS